LKPESASGQSQTWAPTGDQKTNYAAQQQQTAATAATTPAMSFAFNVCPPSPESPPTHYYLPGMHN